MKRLHPLRRPAARRFLSLSFLLLFTLICIIVFSRSFTLTSRLLRDQQGFQMIINARSGDNGFGGFANPADHGDNDGSDWGNSVEGTMEKERGVELARIGAKKRERERWERERGDGVEAVSGLGGKKEGARTREVVEEGDDRWEGQKMHKDADDLAKRGDVQTWGAHKDSKSQQVHVDALKEKSTHNAGDESMTQREREISEWNNNAANALEGMPIHKTADMDIKRGERQAFVEKDGMLQSSQQLQAASSMSWQQQESVREDQSAPMHGAAPQAPNAPSRSVSFEHLDGTTQQKDLIDADHKWQQQKQQAAAMPILSSHQSNSQQQQQKRKQREAAVSHLITLFRFWNNHGPMPSALVAALRTQSVPYVVTAILRSHSENLHKYTIVDVGANNGYPVTRFGLMEYVRRVISIDPDDRNIKVLRGIYKPKNVSYEIFDGAAGRKIGRRTMMFSKTLDTSGCFAASWRCLDRSKEDVSMKDVRVTTVDNLVQSRSDLDDILLLKTDTQGFEGDVLAGAKQLMSQNKIRYIILEYDTLLLRTASIAKDLLNLLLSHRFSCTHIKFDDRKAKGSEVPAFSDRPITWAGVSAFREFVMKETGYTNLVCGYEGM